jgi:hypothetical protein
MDSPMRIAHLRFARPEMTAEGGMASGLIAARWCRNDVLVGGRQPPYPFLLLLVFCDTLA